MYIHELTYGYIYILSVSWEHLEAIPIKGIGILGEIADLNTGARNVQDKSRPSYVERLRLK